MSRINRRSFLKKSAAAGAMTLAGSAAAEGSKRLPLAVTTPRRGPNEEIRVACVGFRSQGGHHIRTHAAAKHVRVVALCDIDERIWPQGFKIIEKIGDPKPKAESDVRRVLDDKEVDCVSIATPNHWHSLAAIWACQAGKDVYVEKPCSHNIFEGRKLIEAARKYNRIVQHGTQYRSFAGIREAMKLLHEGVIGEVYMARSLCYKTRGPIGNCADGIGSDEKHQYILHGRPGPNYDQNYMSKVNYDIWQGPATKRRFNYNRFHYNWHWNWDYGNGDIGNQGVHQMDIARWGLNETMPIKVHSMGGRYTYKDQAQTPNTLVSTFQFADGKMLVKEVRGRATNQDWGIRVGNLFYGSKGYMAIRGAGVFETVIDGQPGPKGSGADWGAHIRNFHDAVRSRKMSDLNSEIEEGHYTSALCHLANISYRLGRSLEFDPKTETFGKDREANALLTRKYRAPFTVPEKV